MVILKKSQILQGINDPKAINIKALGGELWLRPLSSAELDEIDQIEAKMMESYETNERANVRGRVVQSSETNSKGKLNMVKAARYSAEARDMKIYKSLDNPKNTGEDAWTLEEVGSLPKDAVEEIVEAINELSGLTVSKGDIDKFPEDE